MFDEIQKRLEFSYSSNGSYYVDGLPLFLSSNPYDYVRNNDEYDSLVDLGVRSLPVIEDYLSEYLKNSDGLYGYILAIAIEDIAKIDFKETEEYKWATGSSFLNSWKNAKTEVEKVVYDTYYDETLSDNEKTEIIIKFGVLSLETLESIKAETLTYDINLEDSKADVLAEKLVNLITTSDRDTLVGIANREFPLNT